jgi:flagellar biosynthesis protein
VPIYEDPELALALAGLEVGEEIPPELYQVVAAVIAWVYELEEKELPPGRRILR